MTLLATDKNIVVVGLGTTGISCARYLTRKGIPFSVMDSRTNPPGLAELNDINPMVDVVLGRFDREILENATEIWLSPGVPLAHPDIAAVSDRVPVRGDVDVFSKEVQAPMIAITGSNGKSTVTTLVGEMARACGVKVAVGGNLGIPVLDLLAEDVDLYVVELSSFQLETTEKLGATAATILNVSQDHMDRYLSMVAYHLAKLRIFFGCQHLILNKQDSLAQPPIMQGVEVSWFSLGNPEPGQFGLLEDDDGRIWLGKGVDRLFAVDELLVKGQHNWANCLASLALAEAAGLEQKVCLDTLRQFRGLPHRCEMVREVNAVSYINDSKATNVGATLAALEGMGPVAQGKLLLIAGGQGKGQDFTPLFAGMERWVDTLVVLGEAAGTLRDGAGGLMPVHQVNTLQEAVAVAADLAQPGDTVLLSPACASFDMFAGYQARGDAYKQWVEAL